MFNKKVAFALVSLITLSASSAMAQANDQIGIATQESNTFNYADHGNASSRTFQNIDQGLYQKKDPSYFGHGSNYSHGPDYNSQLGVATQKSDTFNYADYGDADAATYQNIDQYLYQK